MLHWFEEIHGDWKYSWYIELCLPWCSCIKKAVILNSLSNAIIKFCGNYLSWPSRLYLTNIFPFSFTSKIELIILPIVIFLFDKGWAMSVWAEFVIEWLRVLTWGGKNPGPENLIQTPFGLDRNHGFKSCL